MSIFKKATLAAALAVASVSAHAAETHISVWAEVDTSLALLKDDGTALPDAVEMVHNPANGLVPHSQQVRVYTNDVTKDIQVRLISEPSLIAIDAAAGAVPVPLRVSLNNRALALTNTDFTAADLYAGGLPGASVAMPLEIAQAVRAPVAVAGRYEGMVSIAMVQSAGSP